MKIGKRLLRIDSDLINKTSHEDLEKEMEKHFSRLTSEMVKRQKGIGALGKVLEDGNYFDLFIRARDNYIIGWHSSALVLSRIVAEQICIKLLEDSGNESEKWESKPKKKQKLLDSLIKSCKSLKLLSAEESNKLDKVKTRSEEIIHAKGQLKSESSYASDAFSALKFLGQVISNRFDYISKTGRLRGYKYIGQTKRL